MRSACAICDRPVDLEAAPAEGGEVICDSCRKEVAPAPAAPPPTADPAPSPKQGTSAGAEPAPASRRRAGKASFWIDDDAAAARKPEPAKPEPKPRVRDAHDSSFDDLKLLAGDVAPTRAPRHEDDLFNLRAEYFEGSKGGPVLAPPDLGATAGGGGDQRLAPTLDLVAALAPPKASVEAASRSEDASKRRAMLGVGAGVVFGVLITIGIGQALRPGAPQAPAPTATAAAAPARTAAPVDTVAIDEPKVKAITPGAKAAPEEPPVAPSATAAVAADPKAAPTPGTTSPGAAAPAGGAVAQGGAKEAGGGKAAGGDAKGAKEAATAEPAAPAQPSQAEALLAAQNAALNAPKGNPFSRSAAATALSAAAGQASGCKKEGDPSGIAKVSITFAPSGRVTNSQVVGGPYIGSAAGGCIARAFRSAQVPAFDGEPVTVQKAVDLR